MVSLVGHIIQNPSREEKERCPICLNDFKEGEQVYGHKINDRNHVSHFMHDSCAEKVLIGSNKCPCCRSILLQQSHPSIAPVYNDALRTINTIVSRSISSRAFHRIELVGMSVGGTMIATQIMFGGVPSAGSAILGLGGALIAAYSKNSRVNNSAIYGMLIELCKIPIGAFAPPEIRQGIDYFVRGLQGFVAAGQITIVPVDRVEAIDAEHLAEIAMEAALKGKNPAVEKLLEEKAFDLIESRLTSTRVVATKSLILGGAASVVTAFLGAPATAVTMVAAAVSVFALKMFHK